MTQNTSNNEITGWDFLIGAIIYGTIALIALPFFIVAWPLGVIVGAFIMEYIEYSGTDKTDTNIANECGEQF